MAAITERPVDETVQVRREGGTAIIQVNRPERKNALTSEMMEALVERLSQLDQDPAVKVVIVTGTGDTFLSGADVGTVTSRVSEMDPVTWRKFRALGHQQFRALYGMSKPTIAAINGAAVVGGVDVALACDMRIASDKARFRVGFRRVGLMPSPSICFLLPYVVGPGWAKRMAFTDRFLSAEEAEKIGLIEEIVPHEALMDRAMGLADELARGPSMMIAATKEAMNYAFHLNFEMLRRYIDNAQFVLTRTRDHAEAIEAFMEKREAVFEGH